MMTAIVSTSMESVITVQFTMQFEHFGGSLGASAATGFSTLSSSENVAGESVGLFSPSLSEKTACVPGVIRISMVFPVPSVRS